jgi:GntR family transcriptional regulator / MocR family aminotransferase
MPFDEASWLSLEPLRGETLRRALERTLRQAIVSGALREGVRLPASRLLARQLGVSRGVVSDAYGQLAAQGFLVSSSRGAPVVAEIRRREAARAEPKPVQLAPRFDFTPTTPDVTLFPLPRWLAAAQRVARRVGPAVLDYREPRGERILREALADHLGRTRGVIAEPGQIIIVQGTAQGFDLLLRLLQTRGTTRVAVEDPSHSTQHERLRAMGFEIVPCPVDRDGMIVEALDAEVAVVTPAHQFPTGRVLSSERRRRLVAWAQANDGLIVEDDYDSEFRYDREPVRALQGLAPESVIHLGTVSKTLAPALRLGWLVAPARLADQAEQIKRLLDDFSPVLDQLTLAEFLAHGDYDRHVRRARAVYHARRDRLLAALARHLPELPVEGVAAGMHVLLRLPADTDDTLISEQAKAARVRVPPLSAFWLQPSHESGLVLGYGRLHETAVGPATKALTEIVHPHL